MKIRRLWPLLALLLPFAAIVAYDLWAMRRSVPPGSVTTIEAFFDWQPGTHRAVQRYVDGKEHLVIFGPLAGLLPSGPPAYVFDESGRLIDWVQDSGDNSEFQNRWGPAGPRINVDRPFAESWTR
jgi:hypothetical protein